MNTDSDNPSTPISKDFKYKGYTCLIRQEPLRRYFTGYVKLPKGHKYFGVPHDDIPVDCHWGLTFGEIIGNFYIIGFDCAHYTDFDRSDDYPNIKLDAMKLLFKPNKDENFVIDNLKSIVDQL